ncbi:RdgB/HAM1 family non-canonical purine NTP pyrophosphatase [Permianibacter sp. IMCC34836]|uniref:RdgB/HAM1 family non-canonical purine NTP pyrophosphatase n=1 Tax=Permianibacter fluminis TaxID=2738515 RepID=UPI001553E246|nr:RdgB/HAM1 family non-canonical purine NTP pyrophosphatase [Permianibacter fluminis]NQD35831.1 RdgB/HAM1 family non-canonical purine NTP pyrophosphatase [Permianibacter fluminis]
MTSLSAQRIVLASGNAGKIRELTELLAPLGLQIVSQRELGVDDADETGLSFIENAILKARHAARLTGLPALADDSGLEVDALAGAPGIYSARYAGLPSDDAANNAKLLAALKDVPEAQRGARFCCVLAFVLHADDPTPLIAEGYWNGRILHEPRGANGFGYDPLFWVPETQCASAELSKADKGQRSHRGQALRALLERLPAKLAHQRRKDG